MLPDKLSTVTLLFTLSVQTTYAAGHIKPQPLAESRPIVKPYPNPTKIEDKTRLKGIYVLISRLYRVDQGKNKIALSDPNVDGFYVQATWEEVEPAPGVFDWSLIDSQLEVLNKYHKKAAISINAGAYSPKWLWEKGVGFVETKVIPFRQKNFCEPLKVAIPWDKTFLAHWTGLVKKFGEHYAHNSSVTAVKITGIAIRTDEISLPYVNGGIKVSPDGKKCDFPDDVKNWQKAGYTSEKVINAFTTITQTFADAFPGLPLVIMTDSQSFPPIGKSGELDPSATSISTGVFLDIGVKIAGDRFVGQNNGLTALKVDPGIKAFADAGHKVGYQEAWPVTGDDFCHMTGGRAILKKQGKSCRQNMETMQAVIEQAKANKASYIELMTVDAVNPEFGKVISDAHRYFNGL